MLFQVGSAKVRVISKLCVAFVIMCGSLVLLLPFLIFCTVLDTNEQPPTQQMSRDLPVPLLIRSELQKNEKITLHFEPGYNSYSSHL